MQTLINWCALGLGIGSAFFILFGMLASKDFYLVLGLLCCTLGDGGFAWFLWEQVRQWAVVWCGGSGGAMRCILATSLDATEAARARTCNRATSAYYLRSYARSI